LLRLFEVRSSEIQVTRPYFYKQIFFLEKLVDAHASSASACAWRRPCRFLYPDYDPDRIQGFLMDILMKCLMGWGDRGVAKNSRLDFGGDPAHNPDSGFLDLDHALGIRDF